MLLGSVQGQEWNPPIPSHSLVVLAFSLSRSLRWMEPLDPGALSPSPLLCAMQKISIISASKPGPHTVGGWRLLTCVVCTG